jgi:cell wall-associated NlpC family hydrolase
MATVQPQAVDAGRKPAARRQRVLHLTNPAMKGPDVVEAQKLLTESTYGNFHPGEIDGEYGPATAAAARDAKWALGYPDAAVDGAFGDRLREFLEGAPLPKDFQDRIAVRRHGQAQELTLREKILANAQWGIDNEPSIHYKQLRPMDGLHEARKLPLRTDCSGFVTLCYAWAGAPDPNGLAFSGLGYTGTLLHNCRRIPRSAVQPGDLVVFGPGTGDHVVMVIEMAADPLVVSHGQEKGPLKTTLSAQQAAHRAPTVFLRAL